MLSRHLTGALQAAAASNPVVTLTGPRQSGKTTLVRATFPAHRYLSLEAPDERARALADPREVLADAEGRGLILDEIQRAPELLSYIQGLVDERDEPGRFILTGSQNLLLMESVSQTLAGRTALLRLHPLSLAELHGRSPLDPFNLDGAAGPRRDTSGGPPPQELADTSGGPPPQESTVTSGGPRPQEPAVTSGGLAPQEPAVTSGGQPPQGLWQTLVNGFYPRIHARNLAAQPWLADYVRTYVERDLREVLQVSDPRSFENFLRLAAARTAQEVNFSALAADAGVTQQTAKRWLAALEIGFLATTLPPHHASYRKRLRKRRRLHFLDTGLVCYLLDIPDARTLERHPLRGAVFESFVVSELVKAFAARRREPPLSWWRDAAGREIDILIDAGGRIVPVEVKSGRTVPADAVDTLAWWTALPGNPNRGGALVHGGNERFEFRGFRVLPWYLQ